MAARQSAHARAYLARMDEARTLLAACGVTLHAYDPGIAGHWHPTPDALPRRIDLGADAWAWLEPLLRELVARRKAAGEP